MKRETYDVDEIGKIFGCEVQNRAMPHDDRSYAIFYCWMDEGRDSIGVQKGDSVFISRDGLRLRGRVDNVDRTYYDGTCPVLYVRLTPASLRKWLGRQAGAKAA